MCRKNCHQFLIFCVFILGSSLIAVTGHARELKLLAFGDSLIAGYGLPKKDGFSDQLEATLNHAGIRLKVINAGVSGDTSAGGLSRIDWALGANPDAILLELGANDSLRGIDPAITKMNLQKILTKLQKIEAPILFAGMIAPPNMGKEYGLEFEKVYLELAEANEVIFYRFFLEGVAGVPELNQEDGIHPNKEGVLKIVKKIAPFVIELLKRVKP
ncbi:arylesterase [Alphaproteobacteria bacterium]|nr:arylesterase [Alphaproteobacteria bacterium]